MNAKRIFLLSAIVCIFNMAQSDEQYDVRKTRWGMTPQEVIKSEDYKFFVNVTANETSSGHVVLSAPIVYTEGFDSLLSYVIKDNGLISASYWFLPTNRFKFDFTKELFADDFKTIQVFLEKQYGKPDKIFNDWKCLWIKNRTVTLHLLKEQYNNASHGIIYYDINIWKSMGENSVLLNP